MARLLANLALGRLAGRLACMLMAARQVPAGVLAVGDANEQGLVAWGKAHVFNRTVSSRNFNLQNLKLRVSNPRSIAIVYFKIPFEVQISQGLGPFYQIELLTNRHRLSGYLAEWVPSPPGKHTSQSCMISTSPRTAGKRKVQVPAGLSARLVDADLRVAWLTCLMHCRRALLKNEIPALALQRAQL